MEYRELAEKSGIVHWRRVPALNTDERFIADMADMVVSTGQQPRLHFRAVYCATWNTTVIAPEHYSAYSVEMARQFDVSYMSY